jgi:diguanylate cyclase (GGDEF)-like protein
MALKQSQSFQRTLIIIIWAAATIPVVVLTGSFLSSAYRTQVELAEQQLILSTRNSVVESKQLLQQSMVDLDRLATDGNIIRSASFNVESVRSLEQMEQYLASNPIFQSILMVDNSLFITGAFPSEAFGFNLNAFETIIRRQFTDETSIIAPESYFGAAPKARVITGETDQDFILAMIRPVLQPQDSVTEPFTVVAVLVALADMSELVSRSMAAIGVDLNTSNIRIEFNGLEAFANFKSAAANTMILHTEALDLGNNRDQFEITVGFDERNYVNWKMLVEQKKNSLILIVFALLGVFALTGWIAQRLIKPIRELREITAKLAEHDFNQSPATIHPIQTNFREFQELTDLLEAMSAKIGQQFDDLFQMNQDAKRVSQAMEVTNNKVNQQNEILNTLMQYSIVIQNENDIDQILALTLDLFQRIIPGKMGITLYRNAFIRGSQVMDDAPISFLKRMNSHPRKYLTVEDVEQMNDEQTQFQLTPIYIKDEIDGFVVHEREQKAGFQYQAIEMFVTVLQSSLEQEYLRLQLEKLANSDSLTGLYNRHFFDNRLALFRHRQSIQDFHFALFIIDVNGLKQVNDNIGHAAGDELLKHVAKLLSEAIRESDILARTGGDEFAILLERVDTAFCEILEGRLREVSKAKQFFLDGYTIDISFSLGFACTDVDYAKQLYELADTRMYEDKQQHYDSRQSSVASLMPR